LRAAHRRCGHVLIHARDELDFRCVQLVLVGPEGIIYVAERGSTVPGDISGGFQPGALVKRLLREQHPDDRLRAVEHYAPIVDRPFVVERYGGRLESKFGGHGVLVI
jgi:hypothetical protein